MNNNTPERNERKLFGGSPNLYPETETVNTDRDHVKSVPFMSPLSAGDIPEFLAHRRCQIRSKLRSVAAGVSRLSDRVKISQAVIAELSEAPHTSEIEEAIERERGRLQVWSIALDMKRSELAAIAARLGVAS